MSGGYAPLSAMICRKPIADVFWGPIAENPGFVEGHTFEGNPICLRRGNRRAARDPRARPLRQRRPRGPGCGQRFEDLARKYGVIGDIRGKGLFQAIEFVQDVSTKARFPDALALGVKVGRRALANGLLCRFDPHWIAFGPPLIVTAERDRRDGGDSGPKPGRSVARDRPR